VRMLASQEIDIAIMGRPPAELKTDSSAFAKHPMAFLAAPGHPLMSTPKPSLAELAETRMLVRERGSGTRTTVERFFKDHGLPLRIGSELSSNEAIKQMCAAGFGIAFLSMHTCVLEMNAGLLAVLPVPGNPVVRDWYVMHLASRQLPQVALAFEAYLRTHGQAQILRQLGTVPAPRAAARKRPARRA
jgi:DNA-binding transcriptional LysR family regulator